MKSPDFLKISNPDLLYDLEEYKSLQDFCINDFNDAFPYLIEWSFDDTDPLKSEIACLLFESITLDEFSNLMNEVKAEWQRNNYNKDGSYIAPSPLMNIRNYIKKILGINDNGILKGATIKKDEDNHQNFNIYPNPVKEYTNIHFYLEEDSYVTISIFDVNGNELERVIYNKSLHRGIHAYSINMSEYVNGIYVCQLKKGTKLLKRKILVRK